MFQHFFEQNPLVPKYMFSNCIITEYDILVSLFSLLLFNFRPYVKGIVTSESNVLPSKVSLNIILTEMK